MLEDRAEVVGSNAGLHLVVWLTNLLGRATGRLVRRAAEQDVGVYAITPHYMSPPAHVGLILGYGGIATRDIAPGIARLARAVA